MLVLAGFGFEGFERVFSVPTFFLGLVSFMSEVLVEMLSVEGKGTNASGVIVAFYEESGFSKGS